MSYSSGCAQIWLPGYGIRGPSPILSGRLSSSQALVSATVPCVSPGKPSIKKARTEIPASLQDLHAIVFWTTVVRLLMLLSIVWLPDSMPIDTSTQPALDIAKAKSLSILSARMKHFQSKSYRSSLSQKSRTLCRLRVKVSSYIINPV